MVKIVILFLCCIPILSHADRTHFDLIKKDSVGLRKINGEKFILHKVTKGETLFALNRRYNVPVDAIKKANPVKAEKISIGDTLLIPYAGSTEPGNTVSAANAEIRNTQTAKKEIVLNPEKSESSALINKPVSSPVAPSESSRPSYLPSGAKLDNRTSMSGEPLWSVILQGKVEVYTDPRIETEPMYALQKDIPEGTLIKIVNPVNGKFVVVRTLKPSAAQILNDSVFLYISPVAARYLDIKSDPENMEMRFTLSGR